MESQGILTTPTRVTIVESEACHFCVDAHTALEQIALDHPLVIEAVDARSARGTALMQRHRAPMSPLVLLDGEFFSHGRLPRRKLRALLERKAASLAGQEGTHG
ncbi:MAG: glutaredoxin [Nocardioidaceae bacterium]|nr:glutaredoxin [Nocardioidaceae bacterium]